MAGVTVVRLGLRLWLWLGLWLGLGLVLGDVLDVRVVAAQKPEGINTIESFNYYINNFI